MSNYEIQSIIFKKEIFTLENAIKWLVMNNFKYQKVDSKPNFWRFRQKEPS